MDSVKLELVEHLSKQKEDSTFLVSDSTPEQRNALIELKKEGLIECKYRTDGKGKPTDFWSIRITSYGCEILDQIENPPKKKTNWTALAVLISLAGLIIGVLWNLIE